ncbi:MAG TPA: tetratricopeptide repeat protein [Pseudoclavibacter sp.]|nr:tetratricopeptide repeat protein [Pseudoclavibacter sp.]
MAQGGFDGTFRGAVDLSGLKAQAEAKKNQKQGSAGGGRTGTGSFVTAGTDDNFTQFLELSQQVPVIVDLWATWCQPCRQLSPLLERLVNEQAGRLVLVTVDVDANPQLAQAFQAQSIPMVLALIGGRPAALFTGALPEQQVRTALDQVLAAAAQMGITGVAQPFTEASASSDSGDAGSTEPPMSPIQQHAAEAIERGDLSAAEKIYRDALVESPSDDELEAGLAHVHLMQRLADAGVGQVEAGIPAVLAQADQLFASQMVEAALTSLLDAWANATSDEQTALKTRLLDYFTILGSDSPFVAPARRRLASLMY